MEKKIAILLLLTVFFSVSAIAQTQLVTRTVDLRSLPLRWPDTDKEASQITRAQVLTLYRELDSAINDQLDDDQETASIDNYIFAKLDGKSMYLIALPDSSGRDLYYYVEVIQCKGLTCTATLAASDPPHNLAREVLDITGNGQFEIVARTAVSGYGTTSKPIYTYSVYTVNDEHLVDASSQYQDFFETRIKPKMKATEAKMLAADAGDETELNETRAEIAYAGRDYERRVLGNTQAGLDEARQWASSSDERIQHLAIATFGAIDTPEAEAALAMMSNTPNQHIGNEVQYQLDRKAFIRSKASTAK